VSKQILDKIKKDFTEILRISDRKHEAWNNAKQSLKALDELREEMLCDKRFIYRWVERGLFDKHTTPEEALGIIAFGDDAPWKDPNWNWDVSHKEYADKFYEKFPKPQPPKGE